MMASIAVKKFQCKMEKIITRMSHLAEKKSQVKNKNKNHKLNLKITKFNSANSNQNKVKFYKENKPN